MKRHFLATSLVLLGFTLIGCGSGSSSSGSGSGSNPIESPGTTFSSASLSFGNVAVGSTGSMSTTLTNSGSAPLSITGIAISGANPSFFTESSTCGASLPVNASCSITVVFAPTAVASESATLTVTDNASGSPQAVSLSGTGAASPPLASFSSTSLVFPTTTVGSTSATMSTTLTNTGGSSLTVSSVALGGTNAGDFSETNNCATLSPNATCSISATFTPAAAASYTATITVTDNAGSSPQTITLSGLGVSGSSGGAITRKLYVFPVSLDDAQPDASVQALYTLINSAQSTVDMTMYELQDTTFSGDLVADCARGVKVRVLLSSSEMNSNTSAYNQLNKAGSNCSAEFSNTAFTNTHQKTITVDGTTTAIMTLNLQTQYYNTTRDFALIENDPADITAIEATFNQDWAAGTPYGGSQGASDFNYAPGGGDTTTFPSGDLIWSPTTAQADMLSLINNAQSTILLENEEMSASNIVTALENACQTRHVTVHIAMVEDSTSAPYSEYSTEWTALEAAGCGVHVYADTATGLYIHAKAVVADYGLSTQAVYMGSINYSNASMNDNRELGIFLTDPAAVSLLETTMAADYAGGTAY